MSLWLFSLVGLQAQNSRTVADAGDARKRKDIEVLLEMQYSRRPEVLGVEKVMPRLKTSFTHVPEVHLQACKNSLQAAQYVALALPIMDKLYTHEEVRELLKFHQPGRAEPRRLSRELIAKGIRYENEYYPALIKKMEACMRQKGYRPAAPKPAADVPR